jgi:SAM-dependent methyltransferase
MRRARGARLGGESFLAAEVGANLAERLSAVQRHFHRALDLGSRLAVSRILRPFADNWIATSMARDDISHHTHAVVADEETLPFADSSFDLVVSTLSLHAVNDLPGSLVQIRRALKPDGLFLAALFGGSTLADLRSAFAAAESDVMGGASPRVAPFADVRALGTLLQRAGFALPVTDVESIDVRYREFATVVSDLRQLGESNALAGRTRVAMRRQLLAALTDHYTAEGTDAEGRLRARFDVIYLTGWAPHESQPKPLKPGSATIRLEDALGDIQETLEGSYAPQHDSAI